MNPEAQRVHGLDAGALLGKRLDLVRLRKIVDSADPLVTHNAGFA
jgi:DNA polymerase III epsilon subunit-like protein